MRPSTVLGDRPMASAAGSSLVSVISSCTDSFRFASPCFASSKACRCRSPSDACHSAIDELSAFMDDNSSLSSSRRTDRACLFSLSLPCADLSPPPQRRPQARPLFPIPRIQPRGSSYFHSTTGVQGLAPTLRRRVPHHPPQREFSSTTTHYSPTLVPLTPLLSTVSIMHTILIC